MEHVILECGLRVSESIREAEMNLILFEAAGMIEANISRRGSADTDLDPMFQPLAVVFDDIPEDLSEATTESRLESMLLTTYQSTILSLVEAGETYLEEPIDSLGG